MYIKMKGKNQIYDFAACLLHGLSSFELLSIIIIMKKERESACV